MRECSDVSYAETLRHTWLHIKHHLPRNKQSPHTTIKRILRCKLPPVIVHARMIAGMDNLSSTFLVLSTDLLIVSARPI